MRLQLKTYNHRENENENRGSDQRTHRPRGAREGAREREKRGSGTPPSRGAGAPSEGDGGRVCQGVGGDGEKTTVVEKLAQIFVEVEVLTDDSRPPPKFQSGQSVHQWWATWMAGAYKPPPGIKGKYGRPAWYSSSVFSWEQFCLQACRDAGVPGVALCGE